MTLNRILDQLVLKFGSFTMNDWLLVSSCLILACYALLLSRRG